MTKQEHRENSGGPFDKGSLQKELKEKVKEGVKPSDLRKLKRSKSVGDIPTSESATLKIANLEKELESVRTSFTEKLTSLARLQSLEAENSSLKAQIATLTSQSIDLDLATRHQDLKA